MTSAKPWIGYKRIAFVPVYRPHAIPPDIIPSDWKNVILGRVLFNPRPEANGEDRSLRSWLRVVSSWRADIDPIVLPMQTVDKQDVPPTELEGTLGGPLRAQGVDAAILIMLGGKGAGTNNGFWSRAVMAESNGVWLMELIHGLTGFKDLYHFNNDVDPPERAIDSFDEMSASSQTHPTAFTKNGLGWLDTTAIKTHGVSSADYTIQCISVTQPASGGRVAAVRIGTDFPYVIVEARKKLDQFESGMPSTHDGQERGIDSEGVITYRVQTPNTNGDRVDNKKPLYLMSLKALKVGQWDVLDNDVRLAVTGEAPDSFTVHIKSPDTSNLTTVPDVIGMSAHAARQAINSQQLSPQFTGPQTNSEAVSQSPPGGDLVQKHSKVKCKFKKTTGPG